MVACLGCGTRGADGFDGEAPDGPIPPNVSGDGVVSAIVAKSEGKLDQSIYDDPDAGVVTEDAVVLPHATTA